MKKRMLSALLAAVLTLGWIGTPALAAQVPKRGANVWDMDLSGLDLREQEELIATWNYNLGTKWPSADKLPQGFDPQALMEWGKEPGLGVDWLHAMGYTGKGVNIAYVDLIFDTGHPALRNIDLHYSAAYTGTHEMHGAAVMSLLAGEEQGTAPDASIWFVGNRGYSEHSQSDQAKHAEAIRQLLRTNETLPAAEKFKVIGFSDNIDDREQNADEFREAVREAEQAGVYVFFCGELSAAVAEPFSDRNDPENYYAVNWDAEQIPFTNGRLYVPMDRTIASRVHVWNHGDYDYIKYYLGGLSWTAPYVTGLMAVGQQIDPTLTGEEMLELMKKTAYKPKGITSGGLIDPVAFAKRAAADAGKELTPQGKYILCLYNSARVDAADLAALRAYAGGVTLGGAQAAVLLDVKGRTDAAGVYRAVRDYRDACPGTLSGVQIFGTAQDVPAFRLNFEVEMNGGVIDRGGDFLSDYFYGNLDNDPARLEGFSLHKQFSEKLGVDLLQDWPVARLPLTKGDFSAYLEKAEDYRAQVGEGDRPRLVNFSNPIFRQKDHIDDLGWFLQNRMDREFHILDGKDYTVYGNTLGLYPVNAKVEGAFSAENLAAENDRGIMDLLINSHGQWNNIDQAIFVDHADAEQYRQKARDIRPGEDGVDEVRLSLVNTDTIGEVLDGNYYNLITWTCLNAHELNTQNLSYAALKGRAVDVFAATSVVSNNGVYNKASLSALERENNLYYFYYKFLQYYYGGNTRAESFWQAKRDYVQAVLAHPVIPERGEGNYQFNLHNALACHHLGLLALADSAPGKAEPVTLPERGVVRDGSTLLPMRALLEALGFQVTWLPAERTVRAVRGDDVLSLTLGEAAYELNGERRAMPVASFGEGGVSYIPVRAVAEAANCTVTWNGADRSVTVQTPQGTVFRIETGPAGASAP